MPHYNFHVYQRAKTNKQNDSITQVFNGLKLSADQMEERTNTVKHMRMTVTAHPVVRSYYSPALTQLTIRGGFR